LTWLHSFDELGKKQFIVLYHGDSEPTHDTGAVSFPLPRTGARAASNQKDVAPCQIYTDCTVLPSLVEISTGTLSCNLALKTIPSMASYEHEKHLFFV
jgi:hypothetical protein